MKSPFLRGIREHLRARQYSKRTEDTYIYWIRQYIRFHKLKHPDDLGDTDIVAFLGYLAVKRQVSPATQSIALNALVYLYRQVLGRQSIDVGDFTHATPRRKLPVVLSRDEIRRLLAQLSGDHRTCAELMYGSGLRLMEVCRLRVKDIDLERLAILVSPHTCWNAALTFARCKNNWVTAMYVPPRFTLMCSTGVDGRCAALSRICKAGFCGMSI
jgi:integrase